VPLGLPPQLERLSVSQPVGRPPSLEQPWAPPRVVRAQTSRWERRERQVRRVLAQELAWALPTRNYMLE
jgi:hypothetical protein